MSLKLTLHAFARRVRGVAARCMRWTKVRYVRWAAIALVVVGLVLAGVWGVRVYRTARSLLARLPEARALLEGGPLEADPEAVGALVHGVRADIVALDRDVGWLAPLGPLFRWLPKVGPLAGEAEPLLTMADASSELAVLFWDDVAPALTAVQSGKPATDALADVLPQVVEDLPAARPMVARVQEAYRELDVTALPERFQSPFLLLGKVLPFADDGFDWVEAAPALLGMDEERTYLLLALNEDELRPGGGFISGVGEIRIERGRIISMEFVDSYRVDDFSLPYPDPPEPLRWFMGLDLWVFRDSNWSPSFPTWVQDGLDLYRPGHPVDVDGVIAADQYAARHLMNPLGPLTVEGADEPITGDTLLDFIYHAWAPEEDEALGSWWRDRKAFMGLLAEAAMERVTSGRVDVLGLVTTAQRLFTQKHLQVYFVDGAFEKAPSLLRNYSWDGALPEYDQDYLMLVEANLGFNKASAKIQRAFTYEVDLTPPVSSPASPPLGRLTATYTHTSQVDIPCVLEARYDAEYTQMQDRCYWEYLRVYAPDGSELLTSSRHPIPAKAVAAKQPWKGEAIVDIAPEGAWTVFSQAALLPTRSRIEISFTYTLPDFVLQQDAEGVFTYQLTWVKQAGLSTVPLRVILHMPRNAVLLSASPLFEEQTHTKLWLKTYDRSSFSQSSVAFADHNVLLCYVDTDLDADWNFEIQYRLEEGKQ